MMESHSSYYHIFSSVCDSISKPVYFYTLTLLFSVCSLSNGVLLFKTLFFKSNIFLFVLSIVTTEASIYIGEAHEQII